MELTQKPKPFSSAALGIRLSIPIVLGYVPVGIAYAIMARQAGLSIAQTCSMSLFVFAGASQMMAVEMLHTSSFLTIVLATFILNLRHVIMSVCVFNQIKGGSLWARLISAFWVTDESFAVFSTQPKKHSTLAIFFYMAFTAYLSWNAGTLIGAVASDFIPPILTAALGVSLYALFIGLLVPSLPGNSRLIVLVVLTAVCNFFLRMIMASSWAMIASTLLGAFAGTYFVDLKDQEAKETEYDQ